MATATKAELTAERERLAARLAEIDAQLARPVLPEGWNDPADPPTGDEWRYVLIRLCETDATAARVTGGWCCGRSWMEGDARGQDVTDRVIGWREIPADWLAPAEAVVKESLTVEATTAELLEWLDSLVDHGPATKKGEFVRARILAFDHSVDLRGVWEPVGEKHRVHNRVWLANIGGKVVVVVWSNTHELWWTRGMCESSGGYVSDSEITALADPAAFMPKGGGE